MKKKLHKMSVSALCHATEDQAKVKESMEALLGEPIDGMLEVTEAEGVHHNPIVYFRVQYNSQRDIMRILSRWKDMRFWQDALDQMEQRLDVSQVFHLRVDKETACEGNIGLWSGGESIDVTLKIATFPSSREKALLVLEGLRS